jgi:hypothetical protein
MPHVETVRRADTVALFDLDSSMGGYLLAALEVYARAANANRRTQARAISEFIPFAPL